MTDTTDTPTKKKTASQELREMAARVLKQADDLSGMGADDKAVATMLDVAGGTLKDAARELRREAREAKKG